MNGFVKYDMRQGCTQHPTQPYPQTMLLKNPEREGRRNIYTTKVNLRYNPGLGFVFPFFQYFTLSPLALLQLHQDLAASGCLCSLSSRSPKNQCTPSIQVFSISHYKTRPLTSRFSFFPFLSPSTQAKLLLCPPDYHGSFTHCCFSISCITCYF